MTAARFRTRDGFRQWAFDNDSETFTVDDTTLAAEGKNGRHITVTFADVDGSIVTAAVLDGGDNVIARLGPLYTLAQLARLVVAS